MVFNLDEVSYCIQSWEICQLTTPLLCQQEDYSCSELSTNQSFDLLTVLFVSGRQVSEEVKVGLFATLYLNLKLAQAVTDLQVFVFKLLEGLDVQCVNNASRGGFEANVLSHFLVEGTEDTEAAALVEPVEV